MATEDSTETLDQIQLSNGEYLENCWRNEERGLPPGVCNRLLHVDRSLHAIQTIARMLAADEQNGLEASAEGVKYKGLGEPDRWGLRLALGELACTAGGMVDEIREGTWKPAG